MSRAPQKLPDPPRVHTGQGKKTRRQSNTQTGNSINKTSSNQLNNNNNNNNNNNSNNHNNKSGTRHFEKFKSVFARPDPRSESPGKLIIKNKITLNYSSFLKVNPLSQITTYFRNINYFNNL